MTHLIKTEEELVEEIMENFNFAKCKLTMDYLNWTWGFTGLVPTVQDIKESAKERIYNAIDGIKKNKNHSYRDAYVCSSGGLKASVWKNRYGMICDVQLEFVLTDWATF